ncbi:Fc.00g023470.m01.CDS01 [Cosmosporella sp. VM-42]
MDQSSSWTAQTYLTQKLKKGISTLQLFLLPSEQNEKAVAMDNRGTQLTRRSKRTLAERMPPGAWDSHMHVFDLENYELIPNAIYRPNSYSLEQALEFESTVGIDNIVIVQPSIYGNDNSCLLDALKGLGPKRGRGVVSFDPNTTSMDQLREWHELGVRGARFNVQSSGRTLDPQELSDLLHQYADAVRPLDWVVQAYVPMHLIDLLAPIIPTLNVRFCIDHIGHPSLKGFTSANPYDLPGFPSLMKLLEGDHIYIKLSAPYRTSQVEDNSDIEPFAREIIRLKGTSRVVFATDWPHTRYEGLDIRPWMETVFNWCGDDDFLIDRLFRENAEDLWDVKTEQ